MATTARRGLSVKRQDGDAADEARQVVRDQVEELARAGARQMLLAALDDEVNAYLQRDRYQRQTEFRGYRNAASCFPSSVRLVTSCSVTRARTSLRMVEIPR